MKTLLDNYKKIKRLQYWAKQTFLNEKGQEIIPTLENLEVFEKELDKIVNLTLDIRVELLK